MSINELVDYRTCSALIKDWRGRSSIQNFQEKVQNKWKVFLQYAVVLQWCLQKNSFLLTATVSFAEIPQSV